MLMPNPHSTGKDSENLVTLLSDVFLHKLDGLTRLRIILRQPSPNWNEFGITNFCLVCGREHTTAKVSVKFPHPCFSGLRYEVDLLA